MVILTEEYKKVCDSSSNELLERLIGFLCLLSVRFLFKEENIPPLFYVPIYIHIQRQERDGSSESP